MTSAPGLGKLAIAAIGASLLAPLTGCVEASVHEKTASQLDAMTKAMAYKDQQARVLEWQVASLAHQLREATAKHDAAMRELAPRLTQASEASQACEERLRREEAEQREIAARLAALESGPKGARARPDELRRLVAVLDAQHARLVDRIERLSQKLDARAAEEKNAARQRPVKQERTVDADIVDPWGFGLRK